MGKITLIMAGVFWLACAPATAKVFGTLESGYASFSNFRAVSSERDTITEGAFYSAANIGAYHALSNNRTALLAKVGLQNVRFNESKSLDNEVVNGGLGIYHRFRGGTSVLLLGDWRELTFEDRARNDRVASGKLQLRKPFWQLEWQTEAYYEQGTEQTLSGKYTGYGISSALKWGQRDGWQLSLGAGLSRNEFDQTVLGVRQVGGGGLFDPPRYEVVEREAQYTEDVAGAFLGVTRSLWRWLYIRGSAAFRRITSEEGEQLDGQTYSLSLGVEF